MEKTRINLANPQELLEIPGFHQDESDTIVRHRTAHGEEITAHRDAAVTEPITDRTRNYYA